MHAVEQLESRTLLTIVPGLNVSVGTDVTVTGSPGEYDITVSGGAASLDQNLGSPTTPDWNNATVNAVNGADIVLNTSQTLYSLTLADTSKISISAGTGDPTNGNVLDITDPNTVTGGAGGLFIAPGATLDLSDNDLILANGGSAGVAQIQSLVLEGYSTGTNGKWSGAGLTSSTAAATDSATVKLALGFALNSSLSAGRQFTTFGGVTVNANDDLIKCTFIGDANLDGVVNNPDLDAMKSQGFPASGTTWSSGTATSTMMATPIIPTLTSWKPDFMASLADPNFSRDLNATGMTITPIEGQPYTGVVATFTDLYAINAGTQANASDYNVTIIYGGSSDITCTTTVVPTGQIGVFNIDVTSSAPLADPNALILAEVTYSTSSGHEGQLGALSEPIQIIPAVENLTANAVSPGRIDLNWDLHATQASYVEVQRSTDGMIFNTIATIPSSSANPITQYSDTDSALTENTPYYYQVLAIQPDPVGASNPSNVAYMSTVPAVDNLTATATSMSAIGVGWNLNIPVAVGSGPGATGIEIDRSTDNVNFTPIATNLDPTLTTYADTGLPDNTTYWYQVRAITASGPTSFTDPEGATTAAVISNLTATAITTAHIQLAWTDNVTTNSSISVFRSVDGGSYDLLVSGLAYNAATYDDTTVSEGHTYDYAVQAVGSPSSTLSDPAEAVTLPIVDLTATATSPTSVAVSWLNLSTNATAVEVDASTDGTTFTPVTSPLLSGTAATFSDTALTANTEYWFQAIITEPGGSTTTDPVSVFTLPLAPTGVSVTSATPTEVDLAWSNPGSSSTVFQIERSDDNGVTYNVLGQADAGSMTYQDTTVVEDWTYYYKVDAVSQDGSSVSSATPLLVFVPLAPPTQLIVAASDSGEVDLLWTDKRLKDRIVQHRAIAGWKQLVVPRFGRCPGGQRIHRHDGFAGVALLLSRLRRRWQPHLGDVQRRRCLYFADHQPSHRADERFRRRGLYPHHQRAIGHGPA